MSTIYDIAKAAGVSPSTVSRALSHNGYCSEAAKRRIREAAKELDYVPDHSARILRTKKTERILFAIPDICNPFYFDMINGANGVFEKYGYLMILYYTKHSLREELKAIQNLKERIADGMIIVSFNFCAENIGAINRAGAPVVLANRYCSPAGEDRFSYVYVDTYLGIRQTTEHLLRQGHEKIAFIGGDRKEQIGFERFCGYRDAMLDAGRRVEERYVCDSNYTESGGYLCSRRLLSLRERPTAVVAANDLMALGFMSGCEEAGVGIPDEIALVGMDDTELSRRVSPRLSTVAMMQEETGRRAAQILMDRLEGGRTDTRAVRLLPRLLVRESSVRTG